MVGGEDSGQDGVIRQSSEPQQPHVSRKRRARNGAPGDWGTPSEYVRELIRQDKERRLGNLEQELIAAAKGPKIEVSLAEIRRKGLVAALRERVRRS